MAEVLANALMYIVGRDCNCKTKDYNGDFALPPSRQFREGSGEGCEAIVMYRLIGNKFRQ